MVLVLPRDLEGIAFILKIKIHITILTIPLVVVATQIATMDLTFLMIHRTKKNPNLHIGQIMPMIVTATSKTTTRKEADHELWTVENRNPVLLEKEIEMKEIRKLSLKINERKIEKMIMDHVVKEEPMIKTNRET